MQTFPLFIEYLVRINIGFALVYLVYFFFLRKLTFFKWNRFYLWLAPIIVMLLPFLKVDHLMQKAPAELNILVNPINYNWQYFSEPAANNPFPNLLLLGIFSGMVVFFGRLLVQLFSLFILHKNSRLWVDEGIKIYAVNQPILPFSFGKAIYINPNEHTQDELLRIIRHETVHIRQQHFLDLMFMELLCVLNWFNPFVWLLRSSTKENCEFEADKQVLTAGFDKKEYQYLLLKVTGNRGRSFANSFNYSSLKKRISMMNKKVSKKVQLFRFLLVVPLAAFLLVAFRNSTVLSFSNDLIIGKDTVPEAKKKQNTIQQLNVIKNEEGEMVNKIQITLKNGTVETFDLDNPEDRANFDLKYGKNIYKQAPPPPPVDPNAPPPPPTPPIPWSSAMLLNGELAATVESITIEKPFIRIKYKNGETDAYNLENSDDRVKFEDKFGKIAPPPPPKPPSTSRISPLKWGYMPKEVIPGC